MLKYLNFLVFHLYYNRFNKKQNMKKVITFLVVLFLGTVCLGQEVIFGLEDEFVKVNQDITTTKQIGYSCDTLETDTICYSTIDICDGDSIILHAITAPIQENALYIWDWGDGVIDTTSSSTNGHKYGMVTGFNVTVTLKSGSWIKQYDEEIRVRIAKNPIKTLNPLPDICSGTELGISTGFGANSSIVVDSLSFERQAKERNENTVFIPDGPQCHHVSPSGCYDAPVVFDQFPPGAVVQDGDDILALCINMEHSYLGDLKLEVFCPNGQSILLKDFYDGNGANLGNDIDETYNPNCCDTSCAPMGEGWTYCFSNQYLDGAQGYIGNVTSGTVDSTNTVDTTGYYQPMEWFDQLVGCPLNGEWILRVCDTMSIDNGFVFWWDLELGQTGVDWSYQVSIDSVLYSGVDFVSQTDSVSGLFSPSYNDYGIYDININIKDEFGCVWGTATTLTVIQTPVFSLGEDKSLCEKETTNISIPIEADNYIWSPTGETTQTITAIATPNTTQETYVAMATNFNNTIACSYRDTILINTHPGILASFSADKIPIEGCEPFDITLINTSTNNFINTWYVGDDISNDVNPSFTLPYGVYDVKLVVESQEGCRDSIWYNGLINVFSHPKADFGWEPANPYLSDPTINIINLTEPLATNNQYLWTIQVTNGVVTIEGEGPMFTWTPDYGRVQEGDYTIQLDAYSVNVAPSGFVYECHDRIERLVTIINDNLLFPNTITPNGDGINDMFVIANLIEGQAYPDNELSIYDRNGKRVFFVQDIRNEDDFWKPTNEPTGTYFYRFIGRGPIRNVEYNGVVELLR